MPSTNGHSVGSEIACISGVTRTLCSSLEQEYPADERKLRKERDLFFEFSECTVFNLLKLILRHSVRAVFEVDVVISDTVQLTRMINLGANQMTVQGLLPLIFPLVAV